MSNLPCPDQLGCFYCGAGFDKELHNCPLCGESPDPKESCPGCPACGGRGYTGKIPLDVVILGIAGPAGSGKNYIAKEFLRPHGFHEVAFAEGFKHKVVGMGFQYDEVFDSKPPTVRRLLQEEGTANGRDRYGRQLWLRTLESFIIRTHELWGIKRFVVTDVRFKNELAWVHSLEGEVGFINSDRGHILEADTATHVSETEMQTIDNWDFRFTNNLDTTDGDLYEQVKDFLQIAGIVE
ncbi:hypothetical protein LCGC14_0444090 [marine sediment metagenome]|uniref:Adenylate kinase n=1 Tax=marine sediment metagenome TaxID=412755 RepID=A0A0F9SJJ1_9ZZZZ